MRLILFVCFVATVASMAAVAQPDQYGWRHDPYDAQRLSPEVQQALRHYCQIMRERHGRASERIPRLCRRMFPSMFFPQRP